MNNGSRLHLLHWIDLGQIIGNEEDMGQTENGESWPEGRFDTMNSDSLAAAKAWDPIIDISDLTLIDLTGGSTDLT